MQRLFKNSCFAILVAATVMSGSAFGDDDEKFESAFSSSGLPWYDSESRNLKNGKAPARPASVVADRNRMPGDKSAPKTIRKNNQLPPAAPAAAPAAAANNAGMTIVTIIGGILTALLVGALVYWFLKMESLNGPESDDSRNRKRKISDHIQHLPFEIEEQEGDFETFAEKSLHEGDYSGAVIYLFADLLVAMSESGTVRLQRGKTNRQYLNEIWDHQEIKPYYQKVMTAFEDAFFGKHEIGKERAEDCFAGRPGFHAGLEKIKQQRFAAENAVNTPIMPAPGNVSVEATS